jgi:hypothetical protein
LGPKPSTRLYTRRTQRGCTLLREGCANRQGTILVRVPYSCEKWSALEDDFRTGEPETYFAMTEISFPWEALRMDSFDPYPVETTLPAKPILRVPQTDHGYGITLRLSLFGNGDALSYGSHRHSCRTSVGCGYGSRRQTARCNRRRRTREFAPSDRWRAALLRW